MNDILKELTKPFHPSHVIWKPGAVKGNRALAMPYADLRAYMNRLDEVCGSEWEVSYEPWGQDRIICRLTIAGVTRSSTGESTNESEKSEIGGTVAEAQAFKRASAMFGLGRYLYNLPSGWEDYDPATRKFTDKAKAKLTGLLVQHYRRATDKAVTVEDAAIAQETPQTHAVEATDDTSTPDYAREWQALSGKEYDLVKWVSTLHKKSDGPCTLPQYQFLTGILDKLTKRNHRYALSLLCQSVITKDNLPGRKVADSLLDLLAETIKEEGDEEAKPNPNYRPDMAKLISNIATVSTQQQELVTT